MAQDTSNIVEIDLAKLQLDTENYRLGPQTGQPETIQAMIAEQGEKLVDLAKDIIDLGLSPIDLITVCPAADPDRYRVVEGNRRITALKLLNEPALAVGTPIEKPIRKLAIDNASRVIRKVDCRLLPSKQEAFVWIQRRHDTGLGGAAMIPWNAMSVRRAKEAMGNRQSALEVIDFVMQSGALADAEKKKLENIPVTNLERILEDPRAMSRFGIEIRSGDVICSRSKPWISEALRHVVTDIASRRIKVGDIFDKDKRDDYVTRVLAKLPPTPSASAAWSLAKGAVKGSSTASKTAQRNVVTDRRTLIPLTCKLQIQHSRINAIYDELRRKLKVDDVPNSAAVMFRVFVELSVDKFIEKKKITPKSDKLYAKLTAAADYMEANRLLNKSQLKPVRMAVTNPNTLHSTETLNAYVHNAAVHPQAADLKRSWDSLEAFVAALWG